MTTHKAFDGMIVGGLLAMLLAAGPAIGVATADEELGRRASWQMPAAAAAKEQVDAWLADKEIDADTRERLAELWKEEAAVSEELHERTIATIAALLPEAAELVKLCQESTAPLKLPEFKLLVDEKQPPIVRNNLRLHYGRWLIEHQLYDEALLQLAALEPSDVVDSAGLLFYRGVLYHRFLDKQNLATTVTTLLENEEQLPKRYVTLARLMQADLDPLKPDSLDEVARLMNDIGRHLDKGRAGTKVRKTGDDVIAKLDKMIEELEKQQQQQQQSSSSGGGNNPSSPKNDSTEGGAQGPGQVDPKQIGNKDGWGNLPPRDRQEVLQELSKDLPAHYREVIEQYFRKLARDQK